GRRLLAWFLVLSLVPIIGSNTVGYLVSGRIINSLAERDLHALAELQAHHVSDEIERRLLGLATAARTDRLLVASGATLLDSAASPAELSAASALAAEELERLRRELDEFSSLLLLGRAGMVMASAPGFGAGTRWTDTTLVANASTRGRAFAVARSGVPPEPQLVLAVAIPTHSDSTPAVVLGTVAVGDIGDFLQLPSRSAGDVRVFVLDSAAFPIYASHADGRLDYGRVLGLFSDLERGTNRPRLRGVGEVIGAVEAVPGHPLRLVAAVPAHAALGGLRWLRTMSLVLEGAFVLVLVGVVWLVARGIVRPVHELVIATERISRGDLEASVPASQDDELGLLANRFNDMAAHLRESALRVEQLHHQQMQRAEQLATVGEVAAGIAHELKTPLLGVSSGTRLLIRRLRPDDQEGRRLAEELLHRVDRMEAAIQQLLSYARPAPAHRSLLDLNAVVERSLQLIVPRAEQGRVELVRELGAGLPSVLLDPDQVGQVVVNLALNAIEAMPAGGRLVVTTTSTHRSVTLAVSDTGPGIAAADRERIFRPFYTTKHRGTGLGLAIVRQIVEQHGGTIAVDDAPGGGTRFAVSFPVQLNDGQGEPT
ncbi:MAG TPA: ATP-binding protein, partial [Gemmatimonadaceae bacterium]|nr:ATP-binding protein [Gemmatimonadaceae bacterium]